MAHSYWDDPRLDDIFDQVNPGEHDAEGFTQSDANLGMQLFSEGFVDIQGGEDAHPGMLEAREQFYDWLSEWGDYYLLDEDFWDDWREWYEDQ